jgi:hypothetical protein
MSAIYRRKKMIKAIWRFSLSSLFILLLAPLALPLSADDAALAEVPVQEAKPSPFSFSVQVAPNTSGALEGSASMYMRWMRWLESGFEFQATGYTERFKESDGTDVTVIRDLKNLDLNLLRLPVGPLALKLGATRTSIGCVVTANGVLIDEERFSVEGTGSSTAIFRLQQRVMWLKPLLAVDLGFDAGPFSLSGFFRTSWPFTLKERSTGNRYSSGAAAVPFDKSDIGYETRAGGDLSLKLGKGWEIVAAGSWKRHLGYTVDAVSGVDYVYEAVGIEASGVLIFPVGKQRMTLGAAFVDDSFKPVALYSITPYDNMRVRFIVGTELK